MEMESTGQELRYLRSPKKVTLLIKDLQKRFGLYYGSNQKLQKTT